MLQYNRLALFWIFSFVFCNVLSAQQEGNSILDIFEHEGLLDLKNSDLEYYSSSGALVIDKVNLTQYSALQIKRNVDQLIYLVDESATFDKYDISNVDSVIRMLQTGKVSSVNNFTDPLYLDTGAASMENFVSINKRIVGNLQTYEVMKQETVLIRDVKRAYGMLMMKAQFTKAKGMLTLYFRISDNKRFGLAKLDFVPFDGQQNAFMKTIAQNDIKLILAGNFKTLEQDFSEGFTKKLGKSLDKFEKGFSKYEASDSLFTFRLFTRNRQLYAEPVFYTRNPHEKLSLRYTVSDKRFVIDMLAIITEDK